MAYMNVEFFDNSGNLCHSAILTPDECAEHYPNERLNVVGFMKDEDALKLSLIERGLAHLEN